MEEVLSHLGASPKMPFRFGRTSQSSLERLVSLRINETSQLPLKMEGAIVLWHPWVGPLGDRGGDQPPPSHVWGGCLITDILQEAWPEDWTTKAVVLSPREAILFFGRHSKNEGLPYQRA